MYPLLTASAARVLSGSPYPGTLLPQRHNGPAAQEETRRTLYFFLLREKETLKAFSGVSTQESQVMTPVILPSGVR